jgi:ubiquinone/menaquinone biosynthesis C-methylase UbiE
MDRLPVFILIAISTLVVLILGWRLLSRRHLLPCPTGFIWMLENRIMENVAGSAELIRRAKISTGMTVLDAGCGPGRVSIPLAEFVAPEGKVLALDVQSNMLDLLRERVSQAGVDNLEILHAGLGEGRLPLLAFDRALMVTVLGEIPNQTEALIEIHQALKPGGILSITEVLPDPHYQRREKVRRLGEGSGFSVNEPYVGRRAFTLNLIKSESGE